MAVGVIVVGGVSAVIVSVPCITAFPVTSLVRPAVVEKGIPAAVQKEKVQEAVLLGFMAR
jgi:hypothetical protein